VIAGSSPPIVAPQVAGNYRARIGAASARVRQSRSTLVRGSIRGQSGVASDSVSIREIAAWVKSVDATSARGPFLDRCTLRARAFTGLGISEATSPGKRGICVRFPRPADPISFRTVEHGRALAAKRTHS